MESPYCENYFLVLACSINDLSSWEHLFTSVHKRERTKDITAHRYFFLFSIPANLKVVYTSIPSHHTHKKKKDLKVFTAFSVKGRKRGNVCICYFATACHISLSAYQNTACCAWGGQRCLPSTNICLKWSINTLHKCSSKSMVLTLMATTNQHAKVFRLHGNWSYNALTTLLHFKNLYSVLNCIPNQPKQRYALNTGSA